MKRFVFGSIILSICIQFTISQAPFSRGVNLTNWFQAGSAGQIQFTKFTRQDFINIKSLGCDVIRLPINLHYMTDGEPDYILEPLFLGFLDSVVTWAEDLQIHLLLDNHTFSPSEDTDPEVESILLKVWTQMAEHYKNRSDYLYYEVLNEPHGISDAIWNEIQQNVIDAIREVDTTHTIIVGPAGWNSYNNLDDMPVYEDDKLIYTFHFYDPFLFTHQGASWTDPSMAPLAGVPFPYYADSMPDCPSELIGTWIHSALNGYSQDGTVEHVKELIDIAVEFKNNRNVPIFCGEFGVYIPNSPRQDRINWYDTVRTYLEENEIAWTIWDYTGGFGIFEEGGNDMFEYDIDTAIVRALGLNVPEQKEFVLLPDSVGFPIYTDYICHKVFESSHAGDGIIDFCSEDNPNNDSYCISWTKANQYNNIGFDFRPIKDLTELVENDYAFDFIVRGTHPGSAFDIRFIDNKTDDPDDLPWRIRYTVDENLANWDGRWYHVHIPLSDFTEHGSWYNDAWYNPVGDYDWAAVDRFEIVAEHHDMKGIYFWFDNIHITNLDTAIVRDTAAINNISGPVVFSDASLSVYPNPFNISTNIYYTVQNAGHTEISVFNISGRKIATLVSQIHMPGNYSVTWDCKDTQGIPVKSGIYFCWFITAGISSTEKLVVG
ncbi:MAG: cellulase family glycosylhydrolase [Bacteroidales bacterium]|nr:MAG: cellulase family glycosylhydrolase [Bacteroidales bacterium]